MIRTNSALTYKRLKDLVPMLVDEEVGIISYIQELPRQHDMPDFIYYKAEIADTEIFGLQANRPTGGGTSLDRDKAIAKALGESVERYSSAVYFPDLLIQSSYQELSRKAIHPRLFKLHTPEQISAKGYPLDQFDVDTVINWVQATHISSGEEVLVPAGFVYCPYNPRRESGESTIAEIVSTGLAAHCSFEEAALNGILEVIERDHFMLQWYAKAPCPVIRQDSMTPLHREMIERFARLGYKITILNATADTDVPTIIAMMHGTREGSVPLVIAAATHLDPAVAVSKSIEELALMERLCKRAMITTRSWPSDQDPGTIHTLADHLKWWLNPSMVPEANFLISESDHISLCEIRNLSAGNPSDDLAQVVECIENTGHQVYVSNVTTSDIASLGMDVVRALIPGYVPLTIDHSCRPEGNERLRNFIAQYRESTHQGTPSPYFNSLPHPFA